MVPTRAFPRCKIGGDGVDFCIYPTNSVERKALLDALKDLVLSDVAQQDINKGKAHHVDGDRRDPRLTQWMAFHESQYHPFDEHG